MMENDVTSESDINPRAAALGMRRSGLAPAKQVGLNDLFVLPKQNYIPRKRSLSPEDMANFRADKAKAQRQLAGTIGGAIASYFTGVPGLSRVGKYAVPKIDAEHERFVRKTFGNSEDDDAALFASSPGAYATSPNISDRDKIAGGVGGFGGALAAGPIGAYLGEKLGRLTFTGRGEDKIRDIGSKIDDAAHSAFTDPVKSASTTGQVLQSVSGKIVCTAMNEYYGFGGFRQTIWLKHSATLDPAYEKGYHKLFLPLVNLAYNKQIPILSKITQYVLEHIAKHRTIDIRAEMRNSKRNKLGRLYRAIFEPICYYVGKGIK